MILGTTLVGEAQMKGRISLDLVPCDTHAAFDILLKGTTVLDQRRLQRPGDGVQRRRDHAWTAGNA